MQQLATQHSIIINDFLELSESRYPEWFEAKPFNTIPFLAHGATPNHVQLSKRMKQALAGVSQIAGDKYHLLPYNDRLGISVPFGWASEVIPYFSYYEDGKKELVEFHIWPANTKQQGYIIFAKRLDWINGQSLAIDGSEYELSIAYEVKLCHWNRYVASICYSDNDVLIPLHTRDNFFSQSGKWGSEKWHDLEHLFDEHFKPDFNWRDKCRWDENFTNTDRSYLTMSLGFEVCVSIPFAKFKSLDKKEADISKVSELINKTVMAFKRLIP